MTLSGANFVRVTSVHFGSAVGRSIHVLSSTRLQVITPAHAPNLVNVEVSSVYGTSAARTSDHYAYFPPPRVTRVSPLGGPAAGGTRVTVTGASFYRVSSVLFGGIAGTSLSLLSPTTLTVTAPQHAGGPANVEVVSAYGTSPLGAADRYTYLTQPAPDPVTAVQTTGRTTTSLTLSWTDPTDANRSGITVRRAQGTIPNSPTDGTLVAALPAGATTVTDTGLTSDMLYGYAIFTHDVVPHYGAAATRIVATSPTTGLTWATPIPVGTDAGVSQVSCPATTFCAALDSRGRGLTFNGTTWSAPVPISSNPRLFILKCASSTFCAAFYGHGQVVTFDGTTWSAPTTVDPAGSSAPAWAGLTCTGLDFCLAWQQGGTAFIHQNGQWSPAPTIPITPQSVDCTAPTFCMATGGQSYLQYDGTTWTTPQTLRTDISANCGGLGCTFNVGCSSPTFCVADDYNGSGAAIWNGSTWTPNLSSDARFMYDVDCPADGTCVLWARGGDTTTYSNDTFSPHTPPDPNHLLNSLSCATPTYCVALDVDNYVIGT